MSLSNSEDPFVAGRFKETVIRTAAVNYGNQVSLIEDLFKVFRHSGQTIEALANEFEITSSEMEDILHGEKDLSLTELRMLATALGVVINYSITSGHIESL